MNVRGLWMWLSSASGNQPQNPQRPANPPLPSAKSTASTLEPRSVKNNWGRGRNICTKTYVAKPWLIPPRNILSLRTSRSSSLIVLSTRSTLGWRPGICSSLRACKSWSDHMSNHCDMSVSNRSERRAFAWGNTHLSVGEKGC